MPCVSIVVPAFNEAALIGDCLASIDAAIAALPLARSQGIEFEIIVVDNNSTDETAALAEQAGARVVFEPVNQIARARNAGAHAASGEWLLFVDADSTLRADVLADVLELIAAGQAVGCGSTIRMDDIPWWAQAALSAWNALSRTMRWAAGALMLVRADAFAAVGGFNDEMYAAEEIDLSQRLKKWGRAHGLEFVILCEHPHRTSGRKMHLYSFGELFAQTLRLVLRPWRSLRDKSRLSLWYDGRR